MLREIVDQLFYVDIAQHGWNFAHCHGARTECLDHEAKTRQLLGSCHQPRSIRLVELDDLRNEKNLARNPGILDGCLDPLVNDPLMSGVLIDDDESVMRLRHDVS